MSTSEISPFVPTFKLKFRDDLRRWTPSGPFSLETLVQKVMDLYGLPAAHAVHLKFVDPEGDKVTLASDEDLAELLLLKTPVTRVLVLEGPAARSNNPKAAGKPACFKDVASASEDSETEDGLWTPARFDKFLSRLAKRFEAGQGAAAAKGPNSNNNWKGAGPTHLGKMLARGSAKTDEAGKQRIVTTLVQLAGSSPAAVKALRRVNKNPGAPAAAQALARRALGSLRNNAEGASSSSSSDSDNAKWRPQRVDKYLANLSRQLSGLSRQEESSVLGLVRMLTRGGRNADEAGRERIVELLRQEQQGEQGSALKEVLAALAYNPGSLGMKRPNIPARALAMKALGGDDSELLLLQQKKQKNQRNKANKKEGEEEKKKGKQQPHARLVCDVTVPDETVVAPGQRFTKVWRVANSGELPWDPEGRGLALLHVAGDPLGAKASTPQCLSASGAPAPGETADLSVEMTAPAAPGRYEGFFRLARGGDESPVRFGQRVWARVVVAAADVSAEDAAAGGGNNGGWAVVYPVIEGMAGLKVLPDSHHQA